MTTAQNGKPPAATVTAEPPTTTTQDTQEAPAKAEIVVAPPTTIQAPKAEPSAAIVRVGTGDDLTRLGERMLRFYNVPADERDAALPAALKAAQWVIRYGLTPGHHVYLVKRGGTWGAEDALEAWKESAEKISSLRRSLFDVEFQEMSPEEVKAATPPGIRCHPEDQGWRARVLEFAKAREYRSMGLTYNPPWETGFWRKEAYEEYEWTELPNGKKKKVPTGRFASDTVPNQRTPSQVAKRRAHKAALKAAFHLIPLDELERRTGLQEEEIQVIRSQRAIRLIDTTLAKVDEPDGEEEGYITAAKPIRYEPDGDVIWATDN
jgi:hypothetical protein